MEFVTDVSSVHIWIAFSYCVLSNFTSYFPASLVKLPYHSSILCNTPTNTHVKNLISNLMINKLKCYIMHALIMNYPFITNYAFNHPQSHPKIQSKYTNTQTMFIFSRSKTRFKKMNHQAIRDWMEKRKGTFDFVVDPSLDKHTSTNPTEDKASIEGKSLRPRLPWEEVSFVLLLKSPRHLFSCSSHSRAWLLRLILILIPPFFSFPWIIRLFTSHLHLET